MTSTRSLRASNNGGPKRLTTACAWTGTVMVILAIATSSAGKLWPPRELPQHVKSPMLAIELLRPGVPLNSIVRDEDSVAVTELGLRPHNERETLAKAVKLDFAFIGAYALFLVVFGANTRGVFRRVLGAIVIVGALTGAVFDVVENVRILELLRGTSAALPRDVSLIKWWSLFIVAAAMAPLTVDRRTALLRRWIGYLAAIAAIAAATGGIYGLRYDNDKIIETAVQRLAIAWFLAYVFAATGHSLRDGLQPALDRLAEHPWLRRIANWPDTDADETVDEGIS